MSKLVPFSWFDMIDDLVGGNAFPSVADVSANIVQRDGGLDYQLAVPGFSKEDILINTNKGYLSVSAEKSSEGKDEAGRYLMRGINTSSFTKSFKLPRDANLDAISAAYNNGILTVSVPTETEERKKVIEIT